ncbi:alpha/beta-hydrolase [Rhizoclosmatium globosum]|uniref:triacylglycerol lipase n=1 Tax=Rhizoclosmatium globosum TaxID=329046 RepID=A0A1Y2CW47_9FUNG|nr:alpha/beta-hydrolase [Rhizoclosmatium globosum]|eukprot:ORY51252.1 alpha/beta-hydrolase [Rhizoclosmatium globosum]
MYNLLHFTALFLHLLLTQPSLTNASSAQPPPPPSESESESKSTDQSQSSPVKLEFKLDSVLRIGFNEQRTLVSDTLPALQDDDTSNAQSVSSSNSPFELHNNTLGHRDTILPDPSDPHTVLALGNMAFNAYYEPEGAEWVKIPGWESSDGFGSTKSAIRGYIYKSTDPHQQIIIIALKGTSLSTPFQGGKTGVNDKLNDNKMFSCCCGKAGWSWRAVEGCNCANSAATQCQSQCVQDASDYRESYYRLATTIADAAMSMYPLWTVWTTGHSLGGSLASLVALTFDLPAFTYETPGDLLFAKRIGLLPPAPPSFHSSTQTQFSILKREDGGDEEDWSEFLETLEIYQYGNDGDPIYLGTCMKGIYSSCWLGGYAMETKCHIGKNKPGGKRLLSMQDETVNPDFSILAKESINNHGIQFVLDSFLRKWEYVPECRVNSLQQGGKCVDCENWSWLP